MLVDALLQHEVEGRVDRLVQEVEELERKRAELVDELGIKVDEEVAKILQDLLPTIIAKVGNHVSNQGNIGSQNDNAADDSIHEDDRNVTWVMVKKMEAVQDINGCEDNQKVKYSAGLLTDRALTWWNSELARLVPYLITPETKRIERYIYGLAPQIRRMVAATEPPTIQSAILKAEVFTDEAVRNGSLKRSGERRGDDEESSKEGNVKGDNKRARTGKVFSTITNPVRKEYTGSTPKCTNCNFYHNLETACRACTYCNRLGNFSRDCRAGPRMVNPLNARNPKAAHEAYYECQGHGNNGNPACERAFVMGAEEACQDLNIMTGMFSLNNHYDTMLFDSGADYRFISTTFVRLLDIEPSSLGFSYEIEIASGQLVEINKVIHDCKLKIEWHTFDIDLIPFGHKSFDVIIGIDWLSRHRAEIVYHERAVRIPLPYGEMLRVYGEWPEKKVFPDDLSGLPPSQEVKFRIELIPGAMPVAKSPYRLGPTEMEELSNQLKELQDKEAPKSPTEVRSFLGLVGYYRQFIANFSKIAKSLTILTQKNKKYIWGDEQEMTFQTLKDKLYNAPVLALTDRPKDFVIEPFSDYDYKIRYHPGKENVVADELSRNERIKPRRVRAMNMTIGSSIKSKILAAQNEAAEVVNAPPEMLRGLDEHMERRSDGTLYYMDRIWVLLMGDIGTLIINKAHNSRYFIHPGADKMYYDLRDMYWWPGMKKDIALYVSKCLTCLKVKAKHQRISGLLLQPETREWKCERIAMDFITKFPRTGSGHDSIWVIVDRSTKFAHFLPIHEDFKMDKLARFYLNEIVARHEDMLRECIINFEGSWDVHFLLVEFSYNNNYHSSVRCVPFETLYVRKCHSPFPWAEVGEGQLFRPEIVQETTMKISQIKDRLKSARDRQKSYADKRRKPLEFNVGNHVLLKMSPWKGMICFGKKGKLAPRFVGPFEITERIGPVSYRLRLPQVLSSVYDTFHVSNIKKCLADPTLHVPLEEIQVDAKLNFVEEPIEILVREIKKLKRSRILIVKV
ncbi:putative reverse transcriptase domain-containing protein [Tanacetum coccineum]